MAMFVGIGLLLIVYPEGIVRLQKILPGKKRLPSLTAVRIFGALWILLVVSTALYQIHVRGTR